MQTARTNTLRPRRRLGRRARVVLSAIAAAAAVAAPSAHAAQPGLVVNGSPEFSSFADSAVVALGVPWVRGFLRWSDAEPRRGYIDPAYLAAIDGGMYGLPPGVNVIIDVVGAPSWANGSSQPNAPPRRDSDYAAFMTALVSHFAGRVAAWEVWNEEDTPLFWAGGPDPQAYAELLKAAYPAIKAADPSAKVVLGGLTGNDYPFLDQLYGAGVKGFFDVVGVHTDTACNLNSPYVFLRNVGGDGRLNQYSFLAYREVHQTMLAHGDHKPIWMTEIGWNTSTGPCTHGKWAYQKNAGVSPDEQALFLRQAYHCLTADPYVQVALWFGLEDGAGDHFGLYDLQRHRKPAFAALADIAHNGDSLSEACGKFTGPAITLSAPVNHQTYAGPLLIKVSASDPTGVQRITLLYDGIRIRNYTSRVHPLTLSGRLLWQHAKHISFGSHTLTVQAFDEMGNVSQTQILFKHVNTKPHKRCSRRRRRC